MFKIDVGGFDEIINELTSIEKSLNGGGVMAEVYNTTPYAVFTEYGTHKMDAHAMIRSSAPSIEAKSNMLARSSKSMPSLAVILAFVSAGQDIANKEIKSRTHIDTARLIGNWKKTGVVRYNKSMSLNTVNWEYQTPKNLKVYT